MRRAFTLIELMAVLILLALVAVVIGTLDARSTTHSTARVWRELELVLRRCSAIALEHGGGTLDTDKLTFAARSSQNSKSTVLMQMPAGWHLNIDAVAAIRFDARGRCPNHQLIITSDSTASLSTATLDGVSLVLLIQEQRP